MHDVVHSVCPNNTVGTKEVIKAITIWAMLSMAVLAALTAVHYPTLMSTGANTWDSHGWPGGWLTRNEYKTWVDYDDGHGMHVDLHNARWYISSMGSLIVALFASAAAPAIVLLPVLIVRRSKRCQQSGGANSRPAGARGSP